MSRRQSKRAKAEREREARTVSQTATHANYARRRRLVLISLSHADCAAYGTVASSMINRGPTVPHVVQGDGVKGPQGMVWVPGGAFSMGSDHKLAQRNERPAHNVRVQGFWMDRTHV